MPLRYNKFKPWFAKILYFLMNNMIKLNIFWKFAVRIILIRIRGCINGSNNFSDRIVV